MMFCLLMTRAAADDAGGRPARRRLARTEREVDSGGPPGTNRDRPHRRAQRHDRISLGRGKIRSTPDDGDRRGPAEDSVDLRRLASCGALAAKAATTKIPIVFVSGPDPVRLGLVSSLNRPSGNITGVTLFTTILVTKRLELLRELVPAATVIAFIVNPNNPRTEFDVQDMEAGARALGQQIIVLKAGSDRDLEALFAILSERKVGALLVGNDPFFNSRPQPFALMAARHAVPAIYGLREYAVAGGLVSYGTNLSESYRQAGIYAGRILNGETPTDLPILQPTKFELVVNLWAAKAIGLTIPESFLLRADEVIE